MGRAQSQRRTLLPCAESRVVLPILLAVLTSVCFRLVFVRRFPARGARSRFHVSHECKETLPFQRKLQLGQRRALESEGKLHRVYVIAVEGEKSSALGERHSENRATFVELVAIHEGDERPCALKRLERFGDVSCDDNPVTRSNQRLGDSLEKRRVGSNNENRCHYSMPAPFFPAAALSVPRNHSEHSQHRTLNEADKEIGNNRRDVDRTHRRNDLAQRLEYRLADDVRPADPRRVGRYGKPGA